MNARATSGRSAPEDAVHHAVKFHERRRRRIARPVGDWRRDLAVALSDTCYISLRLTGWFAMTMLASFGVGVVFFLMIGDFTAIGFFSQAANLAGHYVTADQLRRSAFQDQLHSVALVVFSIVGLIRWRGLVAIVAHTKGCAHE